MKLIIKNKLNRILSKSGSALLLILLLSMICMVIVLGVLERTNKQLYVQRQNSAYTNSFTNAESFIAKYINNSYINAFPAGSTEDQINSILNDGNTTDPKAKIILDNVTGYVADNNLTIKNFLETKSDRSLTVPVNTPSANDAAKKISVWCPTTLSGTNVTLRSAIYLQILYKNTDTLQNIGIDCTDNQNIVTDYGNVWSANQTISGNLGGNIVISKSAPPLGDGNASFRKIDYVFTSPALIELIRVIPLINFPNAGALVTTTKVSVLARIYNASAQVIGGSDPLTGTVIGYGDLGRNAAIKFSAPNVAQLPTAFDYVFFEKN